MNQFRASFCLFVITLLFTPLMLTSSPVILTYTDAITAVEAYRGPAPLPSANSLITSITVPNLVGIHRPTSGKILKTTPMQSRNWTILVYLDGDNDLEEYAFDDLNAMEKIGSTKDVNIIVLVDFYLGMGAVPFTGANCYNVTQDDATMIINSTVLSHPFPAEPNMGDPQTLLDFVVFGQSFDLR